MEPFEREANSIDVGLRLRELRAAHNISMRGLAAASGLSANALSMIERGKTSPSVSTLYKVADALGVPITAFFGSDEKKRQVIFVKADRRVRIPFSRGIWEGLGGEQFTGRVEPFILTMESAATSGRHNMAHSGHEFVFCLQGQLAYHVEQERFLLEPGDSLLFAAHLQHRWHNYGDSQTRVLLMLSGYSEDERPHAMHWRGSARE